MRYLCEYYDLYGLDRVTCGRCAICKARKVNVTLRTKKMTSIFFIESMASILKRFVTQM